MASSAARALAKFSGVGPLRNSRAASSLVSSGKVARFTLESQDVSKASKFFTDAMGLKLNNQSAPQCMIAGDGLGLSCDVMVLQSGKAPAGTAAAAGGLDSLEYGDSEEDPLIHPFLTIGVSNLKTSARHAKRQFGSVGA